MMKNYAQALEDLMQAIKLAPDETENYQQRAEIYHALGDEVRYHEDITHAQRIRSKAERQKSEQPIVSESEQPIALATAGSLLSALRCCYPDANKSWETYRAVEIIKKHQHPDETLEAWLATQPPDSRGNFRDTNRAGGLWATSKRLLYLGQAFFDKPIVVEYSYDGLEGIEVKEGDTELYMKYCGKVVVFKGFSRGYAGKPVQISNFINLMRNKIEVS
jgi:tetratricopeptide (TPR) repeat protein